MKTIFTFCLLSLFIFQIFSQSDTLWTQCIGGSNDEVVGVFENQQALIKPLPDSTFILVSSTYSNDGIMSSSNGSTDIFMAKYNYDGDTIWTKLIGGPDIDLPTGIDVDASGNIAICGYSYSTSGDLSGHHGDSLETDGFIARYDIDGNKIWAYQYGGSDAAGIPGNDKLYDVHIKNNGDIVAVGSTTSINGDLSFILDVYDCGWYLQVNSYGTMQKSSKVYGADHTYENANILFRMFSLPNGNIVALGTQWYLFTSNLWMTEFDSYGNISWEQVYGPASPADSYAGDFEQTSNNGYVVLSFINGSGGDVNSSFNGGYSDAWIFKTDSVGVIIDQQCFGGSISELACRLQPIDNDFLLLGASSSQDGFAPGDSLGSTDFWIVRFNEDLDTSYTFRFGGSQAEKLISAIPLANNELIIAGSTGSNDHWVNGNHGGDDIFLARLTTTPTFVHEFEMASFKVFPNPATDWIYTDLNISGEFQYQIFNYSGKCIESSLSNGKINTSILESGLYILRVFDPQLGWQSASFIKM